MRFERPGLCIAFFAAAALCAQTALSFSSTMPFNGCTFYRPRLVVQSFAAGTPYGGCAEFSAVLGPSGCRKVKGVCPACVTYSGDHLRMWLDPRRKGLSKISL